MRYLTARPEAWYTLLALAIFGQVMDLITTALTLARPGGLEYNPVSRGLLALGGWPLLSGVKLGETLLLAALMLSFAHVEVLRRSRVASGVALGAVVFLIAALMLVVGHNLALLYLLQQPPTAR